MWHFLVVTMCVWGVGLLLASSGSSSGMLPNILRCPGQPARQRLIWLKMSVVPGLGPLILSLLDDLSTVWFLWTNIPDRYISAYSLYSDSIYLLGHGGNKFVQRCKYTWVCEYMCVYVCTHIWLYLGQCHEMDLFFFLKGHTELTLGRVGIGMGTNHLLKGQTRGLNG